VVPKNPSAEGLFISGAGAGGSDPKKSPATYAACVFPLSLNAKYRVRQILAAGPG